MESLEVRRARPQDAPTVVATLHAAFRNDPVSCWVFPDAAGREHFHPAMMGAFVDLALSTGEVYLAHEGAGVAVWFPVTPGEHDDADFADRAAQCCGPYAERFRALGETMGKHHPNDEAHLYLNFLAVVPQWQGHGLGGALLRDRLARLDAEGMPAYLEASSTRSAALYARQEFVHTQPFQLPFDGPAMLPMWRRPRG